MTTRRPFRAILLVALASVEAAVAVAACTKDGEGLPDEGGGFDGGSGVRPDVATDAPGAPPPIDAGRDGGHCSAVTGACDIVLQDCSDRAGKAQECVVTASGDTACRQVTASQQLPAGRSCCPSTASNPCLPGLTCIGAPCRDGGPPTGRCSPACCKGDDVACGKSDPEGIAGACDLTLVDEKGKSLHEVCSYRERCAPFGVEPCREGELCIVEDKAGTAGCIASSGKRNREPCDFANECGDGFVCVETRDAGTCRTVCLTPGSVHPFDASVEEGGAGKGGCPAGERCLVRFDTNDLPSWYSACSYPDGG